MDQSLEGDRVNELSLFTGAGGGVLGTHHLLGWKTLGYVEYEEYCQKVIRQRIADGLLDAAPIFGDIRKFISDGYAEQYRGFVDVVTGGFPCQAWSNACSGKNTGENMWPEMLKVVGTVRPDFIFAENVDEGAILNAQKDLSDCGYSTRRCYLSASDMGADHIRGRWWLFAHTYDEGKLLSAVNAKMGVLPEFRNGVWDSFAGEPRMADGPSHRMDRFKAIGNMQVPIVAATAWKILTGMVK